MNVRTHLVGYCLALISTLAAWLITRWLPLSPTPFAPFFAAILVTAWLAGRGAGFAAAVLGGGVSVLLVHPIHAVTDMSWQDAVRFLVFGIVGLFAAHITAGLRQAEKRMRDERQQLWITLSSIGDGVIVTDEGGRVTSLNPVAEKLTGWTSAEAAGQPLEDVFRIVDETTEETVPNPVAKALREGRVVGLANHTLLIAKDGTRRPIDDSASPIRSHDGRVSGGVLVFRDVAERRRKEESLRESEERHRLIAELTSDYTTTSRLSETGELVPETATEGFTKVTGYTLDELDRCGGWTILLLEEDFPAIEQSLQRLRAGERAASEVRVRTREGDLRWVRYLSQPVKDHTGRVSRIIGAAQDITEQKRHEEIRSEQIRLAAFGRDIAVALAGTASLSDTLQLGAQAMVQHLDAACARIWTLNEPVNLLELQAQAGLNTPWDDASSRVPLGQSLMGLMTDSRQPQVTDLVAGDAPVPVQEWARREGLVAFAGYPLVVEDRLIGVMAMFARQPLSEATREAMASVATGMAVGIERKRAAMRLHEEREWLAVTLSSIGDAVIATDASGRVQFLNPVAESLTGWTQAEARGVPLADVFRIINEETRQTVENPVTKVLRCGQIVGLANHTLLIAKDGQERPIDDSAAPIRTSQGTIQGVVLVFRDVTERREAERQVQDAFVRTTNILESITDGFVHLDREWRFTYVNRQSEALLQRMQRTRTTLMGKSLWHEFPDMVGTTLQRNYEKAVQEQVPVQFEEYYEPLNAWLEIRAYPSKDGLSIYSQDVTERKRAEEAIRQQRNWLQTTLTSIGDAVIATDQQERVTLLNPVAEQLTGWTQQEAVGRPLTEIFRIVHEETRQPAENPVAKVLREGRVVGLANHTALISRHGTERPIDDSAAPIKDDLGQIHGVVLVFREIGERKAQERRRNARLAITQVLAEATDIQEAAPRILQAVCVGLNWDLGAFWTIDANGQVARCLDAWQGPGVQADQFMAMTRERTFAPSVGLPGRVWSAGRSTWIPDVVQDGNFPRAQVAAEEGLHSAFGCPIQLGKNILGVLEFFSREIREPDEDILEMMTTVGSQIGHFIDRHRSEQVLRESAEQLRLALDAGRMGVWDWNVLKNHVTWSRNLEAIHGLSPGGFDGTFAGFEKFVHPEDRQLVRQTIQDSLLQRSDYEIEFRNVWPDGSVHWMLGKGRAFYDQHDQPVRMIGIGMDITERRLAEQRIRAAEQRYRDLVNGMDAIVWEADPHSWEFKFVSDRAEEILGYPVQFWLSAPDAWLQMIHPDDRDYARETCRKACLEGSDHAFDYRAIRADGRVMWLHDIVYIVRNPQGEVERLRGLMVDITDRKRLEGELRERMDQLAEADRRKDEFLATLAHELRNPLAPIRNSLYIFQHATAGNPMAERVREMMERQVQHLTRLVDDLLDVSRISRGKIQLRRETVDFRKVVQSAVEIIQPLIQERRHEFLVSVPDEPVLLNADPTRLEQILDNLLNNAAKYTDPGGKIWLTLQVLNQEAIVRVRDSGIGIESEMLPQIFDLFVQADRRLDASYGGLGIGLTLVRRLVELHEGTVEAQSQGSGQGSEFVLRFPLRDQTMTLRLPDSPPDVMPLAMPVGRILVVDDNPDAAESLALLLRLKGHDVQVAHDGTAALALMQSAPPRIVLLDIGLPGLDGFEVAKRIRRQYGLADILLIALTGWGQEEDRRRSKEAGFDYHLIKPVEPDVLAQLLHRVASEPREARERTGES